MNRRAAITELISLIFSMQRTLHARTYRCRDGAMLTSGQLVLLFALKHHGPITAQDLARRLSLTPGAVSQLFDSLEDRRFIIREPREHDRRTYDLRLSPEGRKRVTEIERKRNAIIEQTTAELSDDELSLLVSAHQKMLTQLQMQTNDNKKG